MRCLVLIAFFSVATVTRRSAAAGCAGAFALLLLTPQVSAPREAAADRSARRIVWNDVARVQARLTAAGLTAPSFDAFVRRTHDDNLRRVREGDLDHLVFYALQSTRFTGLPPIEPALSAKAFVDAMPRAERERFLATGETPDDRTPASARARLDALSAALDRPSGDLRLTYFAALARSALPSGRGRNAALRREYRRAMRFVYEKEFVAQRSPRAADAVAELYRARGLSTDTEVEAGYVVYNGLAVAKALDPAWRVRRVLILGPGLDLAPRTGMLEAAPPQSYQPWAVMDALVALGLSSADDLEVVGADINPRVVEYLRRSAGHPPALTLISGIQESDSVAFAPEYRGYFSSLGNAIGTAGARVAENEGHLRRIVEVRPDVARALHGEALDIVTERLDGPPFDVVIATNILPYFDDRELTLTLCNVAAMLAPGGFFLHNEARPLLGDVADALGLRFEQSRHVAIASVREAAPLADSIWLHRRVR